MVAVDFGGLLGECGLILGVFLDCFGKIFGFDLGGLWGECGLMLGVFWECFSGVFWDRL